MSKATTAKETTIGTNAENRIRIFLLTSVGFIGLALLVIALSGQIQTEAPPQWLRSNRPLFVLCILALVVAISALIRRPRQQIEPRQIFEKVVSTIAHDLRGPLQAIQSATALLGEELSESDRARYSQDASEEVELMSRQIEDIVRITRGEAPPYTPAPTDLSQWFGQITKSYGAKAKKKQIEWRAKSAPDLPYVQIDAERLTQCLGALLDNAVRYTSSGRITVALACQDMPQGDGHGDAECCVDIKVSDTGPGIASSDHQRIFEPFERAVSPSNKHRLGVGLALAQQIAYAAHGHIDIQSSKSTGSTFTLHIRAKKAVKPDVIQVESRAVDPIPEVSKLEKAPADLLVVLDDPSLQNYFTELLLGADLNFDISGDVQTGLDRLAKHPYKLVIADVDMPIVAGYTYADKHRKTAKPPRFIGVTDRTKSIWDEKRYGLFSEVLDGSCNAEELKHALKESLSD